MKNYMIICRSMTHAQRSQRLLERSGIMSSLVKAPTALTRSGCGYALILHRHLPEAIRLLKEAGFLTGKVYEKNEDAWRELADDLS